MNMMTEKKISEIYEVPLSSALTENLFGTKKNLDPLDFTDSRVRYYVRERVSALTKVPLEEELFAKFWPPASGAQLLHIVGGAGSGKSTSVRYFFQYFMPHHERIMAGLAADSPEAQAHTQSVRRHILLYVDFRFRKEGDLRSEVFNSLGKSLYHEANRLGVDGIARCEKYTETWVRDQFGRVAEMLVDGERQWYISCIADNSDQLAEKDQVELTEIARSFLSPAIPTVEADSPVVRGDWRTLWRVIIPLRPETRENLARIWDPIPNRRVIELDPISRGKLLRTRAESVYVQVMESRLHREKDRPRVTTSRADGFLMWDPREVAESLRDDLLAANEAEGIVAPPAKPVLDHLVGDSVRRLLKLLPRVAFSEVFHERLALGLRLKWTDAPVSRFYFFEGLIRGDEEAFNPAGDAFVLNLYNLGAGEPATRPHSIFVGIYAVWLLSAGHAWDDVKINLAKIGFHNDLAECESNLEKKELLRRLWDGRYRVESGFVKGHWEMLRERAYTDNMAVACARSWGFGERAQPTDPLEPSELLTRLDGSVWFIKMIWEAEKALRAYPTSLRSRNVSYEEFANLRKTLNLPGVTHYVAYEYLQRARNFPTYVAPLEVIEANRKQWRAYIRQLDDVIGEARTPGALNARQE